MARRWFRFGQKTEQAATEAVAVEEVAPPVEPPEAQPETLASAGALAESIPRGNPWGASRDDGSGKEETPSRKPRRARTQEAGRSVGRFGR